MKKPVIILCVALLILSACGPKPLETPSGLPIISLDESNYLEDPSDLLEEGTFIPLSGKGENGFFRIINRLLVTGDTLIVYDNLLTKIVVFDRNGNYINEINRQGKGPEEYVNINDVFYWNGLHVIDPSTYQIIQYKLDGTWISSQKYDPYLIGTSMERNAGAYIVYRNSMHYLRPAKGYNFASLQLDSLNVVDSASLIVAELASRGVYTGNPFTHYDGAIYGLPPFEDVIYRMDQKGKIDTAFVISVPEADQLSKDPIWLDMSIKDFAFMKKIQEIEGVKFHKNLTVQNDCIGFGFSKNKESHYCLYDKKKGVTRYFKTAHLVKDTSVNISFTAAHGEDLYYRVYSKEEGKLAEFTGLELGEEVNTVLYKTRWKK